VSNRQPRDYSPTRIALVLILVAVVITLVLVAVIDAGPGH
jgi:hypothetical protein